MVLDKGRAESWGEDVRRLNRDRVALECDLDAEAFERLEEFAEGHGIICRALTAAAARCRPVPTRGRAASSSAGGPV